MARIRILGGIFISFVAVFLMSHNSFAEQVNYFDHSYMQLTYKICQNYSNNDSTFPDCTSSKFADLSAPTIWDSQTGIGQYSFDIDTSDCINTLKCRIWVQHISINVRSEENNDYIYPDDNFINIKFWSGPDFYIGDLSQILGNNWGGLYNIGTGFDSWVGTSNNYYSCRDNEFDDTCYFAYWLNNVDYDSNNIYSGVQISASSDLLDSYNTFRVQLYPLNLSTGVVDKLYFDYNTITYFSAINDPFVIYMQAWGSNTIEKSEEDNGTDIANDYYQTELDAVNSIQNQSPSDLNTGDSGTATNLIGYITTFISYISNITPASDCGVDLSFPQYAGGTQSVNLCQFKENFGNIVSIFSSLVLVLFYIPLAYKMLGIIYSEIRSFTNG